MGFRQITKLEVTCDWNDCDATIEIPDEEITRELLNQYGWFLIQIDGVNRTFDTEQHTDLFVKWVEKQMKDQE